jgi:hypothetical protein
VALRFTSKKESSQKNSQKFTQEFEVMTIDYCPCSENIFFPKRQNLTVFDAPSFLGFFMFLRFARFLILCTVTFTF